MKKFRRWICELSLLTAIISFPVFIYGMFHLAFYGYVAMLIFVVSLGLFIGFAMPDDDDKGIIDYHFGL